MPYLLIAAFTGWFCYKFFVERKAPSEAPMTLDWDQLDTSGGKASKVPSTIKQEDTTSELETSNVKQSDEEDFHAFDEMEKTWLDSVKVVIGDSFFDRYIEMRERNEKEKMQAYKDYHDFLRKKHGDKFTYNISEDQSVREKEINQRYLKELLAMIGEIKFQQYLKLRDEINEVNRKKNKEFIQVEF